MTSPTRLHCEEARARAYAEAYERLAVPALFAGWARSLVELAAPPAGARVLDVGCGTGIVARTAAASVGAGGWIAAVDSDPAMVAVAREVSAGDSVSIQWQGGDALDLPFDDAVFDVVFCQQALQFLDDPGAALAEMRRVLRHGGRVAIDTWRGVRPGPAAAALGAALARHLGPEPADELDAPCAFGTPEALSAAVSAAGFAVDHAGVLVQPLSVESAAELLELAALISSLGPSLEEITGEARRRLAGDLDRALDGGPRSLLIEACVAVGCR